jgi:fructokinase
VLRWGIDLGGTKTEIIGLDDDGREVLRRRRPTDKRTYDAIVAGIVELVRAAEAEVGQTGSVGIGTPGSASPRSGLMRNCNTTVLNGRPLQADIERALGREIRMANDANCFALSEAVDGGAAGASVVFGVILGTGVGGGVVVDRRALAGGNGIAGEWGHSPLPWPNDDERPGPACYCGKTGCIETFLSGPGFAADHGTGARAPEIVAAAAAGDAAAEASLQRYEDRLARGLATVINLLDPDAIVLGGGMSNIDRLYERVPPRLCQYVFADAVRTTIVGPLHGDSSGVRGAAWLS